jgi:hypothetical protein
MKRDWSSDPIFRPPAEFQPSERQYKLTVTDPDIRMAVLGIDGRIRPCTKSYSGPPGIILSVSPVAKEDDEGRPPHQIIHMLSPAWIRLKVPPLQEWRDKYVTLPEKLGGAERARQGFEEPSEHSKGLRAIYYTVEPYEDVPV